MGILHVNSSNFKEEVLNSDIPVLVDFYADWCGPCRMIAPAIEELASEYAGKVKICKLNVDDAQEIAMQYGVMSIPTIIVFKNGQNVEQTLGAVPKGQLADMLDKHI